MTLDDAAAFASSLPEVVTGTKWGNRTWMVGDRGFAWQRPFSKADLKRFGDDTPPAGDILAVKVENLDAKDALLAIALPGFFTIPHFDGYAAVLIALRSARAKDVRAAIVDAWRTVASPAMVAKLDVKPNSQPRRRARSRARGRARSKR
jgi:hypothetical protein